MCHFSKLTHHIWICVLFVASLFQAPFSGFPVSWSTEDFVASDFKVIHVGVTQCGARRCRLAVISDHSDPSLEKIGTEGAGGQNVYVRQLSEHLTQHGWDVDMFTRKWDSNQPSIVIHNAYCRTIRLKAGPSSIIPRDNLLPYMNEFLESFIQFQLENGTKYDIIHANYWLSAVVGLKLKTLFPSIPLVYVAHSLGKVKENWQIQNNYLNSTASTISLKRFSAEKEILNRADLVVATSVHEVTDMHKHYAISRTVARRHNINIIPAGVNLKEFTYQVTKCQAKELVGLSRSSKVVLYVGRFDRRKGLDVLIEAIAGSKFLGDPDLTLVIAGGTEQGMADELEFARIQNLVKVRRLEKLTQFPGLLSRGVHNQSLQNWYAAADVVVVPSLYEPFGMVTIEAMSMHAPVVASAVGGLKTTVLDGQTGFLVTPGDPVEFSKRIDLILENPVLADRLGKKGRERVQKYFAWVKVADQTNLKLRKLLKKRVKNNFKNLCISKEGF